MKDQLSMLLIPWLLLYMFFLITHGYYENPFERWARDVAGKKTKYRHYGWANYVRINN